MSAENRLSLKVDPKPNTPAGWLAKSKAVTSEATINASLFTAIAALLAQLVSDTQALDLAQAKAANKGRAETTARNAAWRALQKSYRAFVAGVQGLCDAATTEAQAQALAGAAGLSPKRTPVRNTPTFRGKALGNGVVRLYGRRPVARRGGAIYEWQMSPDGGKTWIAIGITNTVKTSVPGLSAGTTVSFRYRTTLKNVTSEWSQTLALLVA